MRRMDSTASCGGTGTLAKHRHLPVGIFRWDRKNAFIVRSESRSGHWLQTVRIHGPAATCTSRQPLDGRSSGRSYCGRNGGSAPTSVIRSHSPDRSPLPCHLPRPSEESQNYIRSVPNHELPPMRSPSPERGRAFVKTEVFRRVRDAVESGETPALVLGVGGSGKTSLLVALADDWARHGGKTVFISLYEIGRGEDFYLLLRRALAEYAQPSRQGEADLIAGSGRAGLRATMDLIRSIPSDLLLVFDGLEQMTDPSPVIQLLELMSGSARTRVVVSSRGSVGISRRAFRSVFEVTAFTAAEVLEFVRLTGGSVLDSAEIEYITKVAEGFPPAITLLLEVLRERSIPLYLDSARPHEMLVTRIVEQALENVGPELREDYLKALTSLAVLNRPIHGSEYPARALLKLNTARMLTASSESGVTFVHPLVAEAILSSANLTSDSADHTLSSLEFGAEEAERDALLSNSFIALPEFSEVLGGKKNIVIGDRGTGKSAMFARLSMPIVGESLSKKPLVKPLTHPADMLRRLEANGSQLSTAEQFRAGWLTLVAYCIADQVKSFSSPDHARAAIYLKEMLGDDSQTGWMLLKFLKGIGERILKSSVKIKLGPVEIEPAGKPGGSGNRASWIELRAFINDAATSLAASGQMALIPLDRVDGSSLNGVGKAVFWVGLGSDRLGSSLL